MRNGKRGRYTLEFKQEAVRLVESGQSVAEAARSLGVVAQTLSNWVEANRAGTPCCHRRGVTQTRTDESGFVASSPPLFWRQYNVGWPYSGSSPGERRSFLLRFRG